uniref:NADH-ubiquinone oxidoreductase chain 2 n=2 Tax=Eleutherocaulis alte TaxID=74076 RepID=A0A1P7YWC0_9EUPU|nr:NADH dehydrogenase subunit 2 [Eleutherocaulis alte]
MASGVILFSGVMLFSMELKLLAYSFMVGLMAKLGVFPGYFWVLSVFMGLSMFSLLLLMVLSKMIPLMLFGEVIHFVPFVFILTLSFFSMFIGASVGLGQSKLKMMLGASSIGHGGWFLAGGMTGDLWIYFLIYSISSLMLIWMLELSDSSFMKFAMLISISGLPPFLLFVGKASILLTMVNINPLFIFIPCLSALLSVFFYLKFSYIFLITTTVMKRVNFKFSSLSVLLSFGTMSYWFIL